jgi:hypothetical protein
MDIELQPEDKGHRACWARSPMGSGLTQGAAHSSWHVVITGSSQQELSGSEFMAVGEKNSVLCMQLVPC